jgi:hypothetical protein
MTELRPDTSYIPKAQMINDALANSSPPAVGVIISKALQDQIRATRGWVYLPAFVDPAFAPNRFEVITNEITWEKRTAGLKEADLEPYSASETAYVRIAIGVFIAGAVALCALGYFIFIR